jgi:hypothetical protein
MLSNRRNLIVTLSPEFDANEQSSSPSIKKTEANSVVTKESETRTHSGRGPV